LRQINIIIKNLRALTIARLVNRLGGGE